MSMMFLIQSLWFSCMFNNTDWRSGSIIKDTQRSCKCHKLHTISVGWFLCFGANLGILVFAWKNSKEEGTFPSPKLPPSNCGHVSTPETLALWCVDWKSSAARQMQEVALRPRLGESQRVRAAAAGCPAADFLGRLLRESGFDSKAEKRKWRKRDMWSKGLWK